MRYRLRTLLTDYKQFTIRTLLFVMLCLGGILAGFQTGYFWGIEQRRSETYYSKVYSVADAVYVDAISKEADFDSLLGALRSTVDPASWNSVGGPASVQVMAQQPPMIIVLQSGRNHDAINTLLTDLRTLRQESVASR